MKARLITIAVILFVLFSACDKDNPADDNNTSETRVLHLETVAGGCNNEDETEQRSTNEEVDTVITSFSNDTTKIFVGINYICCAPFITETSIEDDSVFITIADTCSYPYQSCYCKCMCYYTWDFVFANYAQEEFNYKITLLDPREEEPVIIK